MVWLSGERFISQPGCAPLFSIWLPASHNWPPAGALIPTSFSLLFLFDCRHHMCHMCMLEVGNQTSVVDPLFFPERLCNIIMRTDHLAGSPSEYKWFIAAEGKGRGTNRGVSQIVSRMSHRGLLTFKEAFFHCCFVSHLSLQWINYSKPLFSSAFMIHNSNLYLKKTCNGSHSEFLSVKLEIVVFWLH